MNRTEGELEDLIQELGKHHGEESFAIVNDIVLSNGSLPEADLFELIASVLGDSAYVRVPRVLQRPKTEVLDSVEPEIGNVSFPPSNAAPAGVNSIASGPKYPHISSYHGHDPNHHDRSVKNAKEEKPIESIWKTVVKEHQADSFTEKPLTHDPNIDTHFEAFEVEQLEDVDPVAVIMEQNPDFFTPVVPNAGFKPSDEHAASISSAIVPTTTSSRSIQGQEENNTFSASKLASQTLILVDDDPIEIDDGIPAYLISSAHGNPQRPLTTSTSLVATPPVSYPPSLSSSSQWKGNSKLNNSSEGGNSEISSSSIDFYLPAPPATEEDAKIIKERLNTSVRASSHWGASGDYVIAPSPLRLRDSLNSSVGDSSVANPIEVIDLTHLPDFKLDSEALDFLGQIFPDFEVSYLADCLRGANNDIQLVSDFLMPVLMEEIEIDTDFNEEPYDYSQHMYDSSEYHQYDLPSDMLEDIDPMPMEEDQNEPIEISDEEVLPEEDAAFNANYHALVEIYPEVDRDWVLDALIDTENNLERAADLLMRGIVNDVFEIQDDDVNGGGKDGGRHGRGGRRGRNGRNRRWVPLSAPNAWARPLSGETSAPLSEYPVLGAYDAMEVDPAARGPPIRIRPPQPSGPAMPPSGGAELLPRGGFGPRQANPNAQRRAFQRKMNDEMEAPRYVANEVRADGQSWAAMVMQANQLFEQSSKGASNAVAAFSRNRAGARYLISALQATNESWISLMEQAGKSFYLSGLNKIDLHSLRLRPASKFVAAILQAHWEHGTSERALTIISGRGAHSVDGISRIKEDVKRQVAEYEHQWTNPGCVRVLLPKPLV